MTTTTIDELALERLDKYAAEVVACGPDAVAEVLAAIGTDRIVDVCYDAVGEAGAAHALTAAVFKAVQHATNLEDALARAAGGPGHVHRLTEASDPGDVCACGALLCPDTETVVDYDPAGPGPSYWHVDGTTCFLHPTTKEGTP